MNNSNVTPIHLSKAAATQIANDVVTKRVEDRLTSLTKDMAEVKNDLSYIKGMLRHISANLPDNSNHTDD